MSIWEILGEISFICVFLFFFIFAVVCLLEKEKSASIRSFIAAGVIASVNVFFFIIPLSFRNWSFASVFAICAAVLLYAALPPRPGHPLQIVGTIKKIDERDVIFARFDLRENSPFYFEYYNRHPEKKSKDDEIRKLPDILSPFHVKKHPKHFNLAAAGFEFLEQQLRCVDGEVHPDRSGFSPGENTHYIKKIMFYNSE